MLPKRDGKPIAFKCTPEFRKVTEESADRAGESLSDYVRKAVEMQNVQYGKSEVEKILPAQEKEKPTIPELKEKVKEMEKPRMVHSFMKGEK